MENFWGDFDLHFAEEPIQEELFRFKNTDDGTVTFEKGEEVHDAFTKVLNRVDDKDPFHWQCQRCEMCSHDVGIDYVRAMMSQRGQELDGDKRIIYSSECDACKNK